VGFPLAAQAARVRREVAGQPPVTVALVTSLPPKQLDTTRWLQRNRQARGGVARATPKVQANKCYGCRASEKTGRKS